MMDDKHHHTAHYVIAAALAVGLAAGFLWLRWDVATEVQTHTEIRSFGFGAVEQTAK